MKCPKCHFENPDDTLYCGKCAAPLQPSDEVPGSPTETYPTPREELATGSTFAGRFQVIEEIGKGGMGRVYKVFDKEIKEKVALKLIKPEIASDEKTIERFRNELKSARKISHRNVCRMYDLSKEEQVHYITMEYVPGEDLKSLMNKIGQLTVGKANLIASQVCEGLAEAHRLGVVHRDLKPRNIMIDPNGNVRIMDFGIARSFKTEGITDSGIVIGTPKYMSPEQVEGKDVDNRVDIYSLGAIFYEMVTGRVPFEGEKPLAIALKQKSEAPQDPREINSQIPEDLNKVILKCLEVDKERRYQSAGELLSELKKIEEGITTTDRIIPKREIDAETLRERFQKFRIPGILVFTAIILIGAYFFLIRNIGKEKPAVVPTIDITWTSSIAVLPFEDLSAQKDQEPFCTGMTEAIITKLSSIEDLKVIPYHTVSRYKDSDKSLNQIGEELDIATILVPTLQKEGNRIRVSAQLTNVKEGFIIESYTFEEEFGSVFEVQDNISKSIAENLEIRLVEDQFKAIKKLEPKDSSAYESYIKGVHFERKYKDAYRQKDFEEAVRNYEEAVEIDENYALAYCGLGNVYEAHFVAGKDQKDLDAMLQNYVRAYEIDPDLAETNVALGWAYFYKEDLDKAHHYFKRGFEIAPNKPDINFNVGGFLRSIGLHHKAIKYYLRAIELNPLSILYRQLCAACYSRIGEFDEAALHLKKALEFEPDDAVLRLYYARQLIMMKEYERAEEEIKKAENLDPNEPDIRYTRALIYAIEGKKEEALAIIEGKNPYYFTSLFSKVYSLLGMKDEAIENISIAIDRGFYEVQTFLQTYLVLRNDHYLDSLRDDPRFKEIVKKQKKKYEEYLKKYGDL